MKIQVIASKATERQKAQYIRWLEEQSCFSVQSALFELTDLTDLPVMLRRVVGKIMRERYNSLHSSHKKETEKCHY